MYRICDYAYFKERDMVRVMATSYRAHRLNGSQGVKSATQQCPSSVESWGRKRKDRVRQRNGHRKPRRTDGYDYPS